MHAFLFSTTAFCMATAAAPLRMFGGGPTGVSVVVASTRQASADVVDPRIKSLNYMNRLLARLEAIRAGADEALMLNAQGQLAEGTTDNVFVVRDGVLRTPPPSDGALEGITRGAVLEVAAALGIQCAETSLAAYDLRVADEAFLVGTGTELVAIRSIDGRSFAACPGPLFRRIAPAFDDLVRRETSEGGLRARRLDGQLDADARLHRPPYRSMTLCRHRFAFCEYSSHCGQNKMAALVMTMNPAHILHASRRNTFAGVRWSPRVLNSRVAIATFHYDRARVERAFRGHARIPAARFRPDAHVVESRSPHALGGYGLRMWAVTAGYHRYFAHRSYKTSRAFQLLLAVLGATTMQNGPIWWASVHRRHHRVRRTGRGDLPRQRRMASGTRTLDGCSTCPCLPRGMSRTLAI